MTLPSLLLYSSMVFLLRWQVIRTPATGESLFSKKKTHNTLLGILMKVQNAGIHLICDAVSGVEYKCLAV